MESHELHDVVVDASSFANGTHDGGEVVVGEDHGCRFLRHLGSGDPHGDPDVRPLQCRSVVHTVAGHRDDVRTSLQHGDDSQLVFRRNPGEHRDVIDTSVEFGLVHPVELGAAHANQLSALLDQSELAADGGGGDGVVAGDHLHGDPCPPGLGDRLSRLWAGRVDDADQGEQRQVVDEFCEVETGGDELAPLFGLELTLGDRQHALTLVAERVVVSFEHPSLLHQRSAGSVRADRPERSVHEDVWSTFDEEPHNGTPGVIGHLVCRHHVLCAAVERHLGDSRV